MSESTATVEDAGGEDALGGDPQPDPPQTDPPQTGAAGLRERARHVRVPSRSAEYDARRRLTSLLLPPGHLGDHADVAVWWCGVAGVCPAPPPASPRVLVLAADHGIAVRGVSALPLGWTAVAAASLAGEAGALSAAGAAVGVPVEVVDVDVAGPRGPVSQPFDVGPAMDEATVDEALDRGRDLLAGSVEGGDLLGISTIGVGATTTAAALVASALGRSPVSVVTRGSGIDDLAWMRKTAALRDGLRLARLAGVSPSSSAADHLRQLGSVDAAMMVGMLVEAAARKVPVIVDGPLAAAAGLLAQRVAPSTRHWWLAVESTVDPLARSVWDEIGVARIGGGAEGAGLGALLAVAGVRAAAGVLASPRAEQAWPTEDT